MSPVAGVTEYDYTILDKDGHRGVKDGKEFPISDEEWQRTHSEHRNVDCKECAFAADTESLLTFNVPRKLREKAGGKPVFVGKFTMPGWSGHSGFYLFKCTECGRVCVDYPHGYTDGGCLYLRCDHCRFKVVLTPRKYREVYESEKVVAPPTFWQELKSLWETRKKIKDFRKTVGKIEDKHGVHVLVNGVATHVATKSRFNLWNIGLILLALWTVWIAFFIHPNWRP